MADGIRDGKGNILKNTDPLFTELAENYPPGNYTSFCNEFGVKYDQSQQIREKNLGCLQKALKQVLNKWLTNGKGVTKEKLELALRNAQTGGLIHIVKTHFAKSAEKDVPGEEAEDRAMHAGSTAVHNTFNVTNNLTGQATDRKRNADKSDGPLDHKRKATEMTMSRPMTDHHRKILVKSTPVLLKDLDADDITPDLGVGIITPDDVAKINSKATRKEKVAALLDILPRRGDDAYSGFLQILETKPDLEHLYTVVKEIEGQDSSEENVPMSQDPKSLVESSLSFDDMLKDLAKNVGNSKMDDLGKALGGFTNAEIDNYVAMNTRHHVTSEGMLCMLRTWYDTQEGEGEARQNLIKALKKAGLTRFARTVVGETEN